MLVLLPAIFLFVTSVVINRFFKTGRRVSLLVSAVLTGTVITFMTEILSLFNSFSFYPVALIWGILAAISVGLAFFFNCPIMYSMSFRRKPESCDNANKDPGFRRDDMLLNLSFHEKILLFLIAWVLVITFMTASASVPNTWDSLTYHLARVEHWIQNKTIAYYPTNILRQLYYCPWAEFALAHLRLLCPWEPIVNFLQWTSMVGVLVCVSLIAKQLGASRRGQIIACLTAAMLPMGILQAVSTQNDYVETLWLMGFIFFVIEIGRAYSLLFVFCASLSLGLALLTKGYGYFLMVPFLLLLIFSTPGLSKKIKTIFIVVLCTMALNIGFYQRNQSAFGSITRTQENLTCGAFDFKVLVGNLLRNIWVEVDSPFFQVNKLIYKGMAKFSIGWLGQDFFYDPRASSSTLFLQDFRQCEAYSGNFLHLILFTTVLILCWFMPKQGRGLYLYTLLFCGAGLLFCLGVRYQTWITRFHLPMFIMFCPVAGIFMDRLLSATKMLLLAEVFFVNALFFLFLNLLHPWVGPLNIWQHTNFDRHFFAKPFNEINYKFMVQQVESSGCHEIGIIASTDAWEYPLWEQLREQKSLNHVRIEHILVKNDSAHLPYPLGDFNPCVVAIIEEDPSGMVLFDQRFKKTWDSSFPYGYKTAVYEKI